MGYGGYGGYGAFTPFGFDLVILSVILLRNMNKASEYDELQEKLR